MTNQEMFQAESLLFWKTQRLTKK